METIKGNKFGAFKGVFTPSILTILGVILFLRLGWVVGNAGLITSFVIITFSSLITLITALSISSTATNTRLGPGGSYFLISRCFGVESGAAVGIPLYLAQALGISFYVVGFAESLQLLFPSLPTTYVAIAALTVLTVVTFVSSELALKMQVFILISIIAALLSFYLGNPLSVEVQVEPSKVVESLGFWSIFAVFFPAVTGIEAGISMSGDLDNPRKSLPFGTLAAVFIGYVVYMFSAYMFYKFAPTSELIGNSLVMTEVAVFPILIFIGLWGATLSSTMGALLGAPRTMQALAKDRILPHFLSVGDEKTNDPKAATIVSFFIAAGGVLLGDLNAIAGVLSMFFLTSYGALNLVSGLESLIDNPSWRPTFRISWAISLVGAFLCFGAMFMINSGASFVAMALVIFVFFVMRRRRIKSKYSDIRTGLVTHFSRNFIYKLSKLKKDARNWRPNFLILSGAPKSRFHLIDLAYTISHKRGYMTVASIVSDKNLDFQRKLDLENSTQKFLKKNKIEGLSKIVHADTLLAGAVGFFEYYGLGAVKPNTLVLGDTSDESRVGEHCEIIKMANFYEKNVIVVKDQNQTPDTVNNGGKSIDLWWKGHDKNINLMITFAHMLQTSKKWRNAKLTLKTVVTDENEREGIEKSLKDFIESSRISANFETFRVGDDCDVYSLINGSSKSADLVFMGLKKPDDEFDYKGYYKELMEKTDELKSVFFVLEGEKIEFTEIFN